MLPRLGHTGGQPRANAGATADSAPWARPAGTIPRLNHIAKQEPGPRCISFDWGHTHNPPHTHTHSQTHTTTHPHAHTHTHTHTHKHTHTLTHKTSNAHADIDTKTPLADASVMKGGFTVERSIDGVMGREVRRSFSTTRIDNSRVLKICSAPFLHSRRYGVRAVHWETLEFRRCWGRAGGQT